ncbi:MAG: NADH-quinone oxidoreductase subunit J [Planctomycetes bacterium]|nr:NADH-quinone oxidoreductase subunit J [Planctomycetota bacterium]
MGVQIAFWLFAILVAGTALYAAVAPKIVHAAFSLMATFFGVAGIYAILGSDFLAVTQVLVYVGGIMVLIVFGVLLTDRVPEEYKVVAPRRWLPALIAGGLCFAAIAGALKSTVWPISSSTPLGDATSTVEGIGRSLLTDYLIPFEFASILLLVVLVGAARLARGQVR